MRIYIIKKKILERLIQKGHIQIIKEEARIPLIRSNRDDVLNTKRKEK